MDTLLVPLALGALALTAAFGAPALAADPPADTDIPYATGTWPERLGNQRARVRVDAAGDAVRAHIPWRRRDPDPASKRILVEHLASGQRMRSVAAIAVTPEAGDVAFQPEAGPGEYAIYFLPVDVTGWENMPKVEYPGPLAPDPAWAARHGLAAEALAAGAWRAIPQAAVLAIEARTAFHRRDPMEIPATAAEARALLDGSPSAAFLLFPEDRDHSIRMLDALPLRWARRGPGGEFHAQAHPGEFLVYQIGVYAARQALPGIRVTFSALRSQSGDAIPARAIRCINVGEVDWLGRRVRRPLSAAAGSVLPLWIGVDVPEGARAGDYDGAVTVAPEGAPAARIRVRIRVAGEPVAEGGAGDIRTLARLRWLDSTIGLDTEVTKPYTPVRTVRGGVEILGRSVRFGANGLPDRITCWSHELLAQPMRFTVETGAGPVAFTAGRATARRVGASAAERDAAMEGGGIALRCQSRVEYDGWAGFRIRLKASRDVDLRDARLEIALHPDHSRYLMGMGRQGGSRPRELHWKWDAARADNAVWIGSTEAGMQCRLTGPPNSGALYSLAESGLPASWWNGGQGGCEIADGAGGGAVLRAFSGPRRLKAGEEVEFCFALLLTPFKQINPDHWKWRYYHFASPVVPIEQVAASGANIVTVHQGNDLNRYINYPFQNVDRLEPYVRAAHARGLKAKIYYTVRELSNFAAELWALRALGHEVFLDGSGGGDPWLREHLVSHYQAAWRQPYADGETDAAIGTTGLSRWHNYYLEGLSWLIRSVGIDGLYLDGIGYDRRIMQRVRKVLDRARPGCLIDFHSGNEFFPQYGMSSPAGKYMEHMPYIDSLWLGEGYDYNMPPDYWLVEISGLPFGLTSEMLQDGGNPWRGMIYGMTNRLGWGGDPRAVWRIWDDFGIADATARWCFQRDCPVRTGRDDVLATAYVRRDRTLIALASWAPEAIEVRLAIDWKALGLDPAGVRLRAPEAAGIQPAAQFAPGDPIRVEPGRGWMLVAEPAR